MNGLSRSRFDPPKAWPFAGHLPDTNKQEEIRYTSELVEETDPREDARARGKTFILRVPRKDEVDYSALFVWTPLPVEEDSRQPQPEKPKKKRKRKRKGDE